jgi:ribonucleoside-diphosphate reductase alpha chain
MQGGSRRSAVWAGLNWQHEDIDEFMYIKDDKTVLDMTNISILWDDDFLKEMQLHGIPHIWSDSVLQMCKTGEPGHCYNFKEHSNETLRNA